MARNNWENGSGNNRSNSQGGTNLWSAKRAREASNENRRRNKQHKMDSIPDDTKFFGKEKSKFDRNGGGNNNNNNQRNNQRNNNYRNNNDNRNNQNNNQQSTKRKVGVRGRDERTLDSTRKRESVASYKLDPQRQVLNGFVDSYVKAAKTAGSIVDVIDDYIEDVSFIMKDYYEPKYNKIVDEMNECIEIMTTRLFMTSLHKAMTDNFIDNWNKIWNNVARTLSVVLETSHKKMQDEVINICVEDILMSDYIWKIDIDKLVRNTGITRQLATDLVIAIPVLEEDFTDATLQLYCPKLLGTILNDAEDNASVLIKSTQYEIFKTFFGEDRVALKVIGRYLDVDINTEESDKVKDAIIDEFYDMIYDLLDDYDIKDIDFVLNYLSKREAARVNADKENGTTTEYTRLFDRRHCADYRNISKAIDNIDANKADVARYI